MLVKLCHSKERKGQQSSPAIRTVQASFLLPVFQSALPHFHTEVAYHHGVMHYCSLLSI